ncbi:MAG: riboflavin kinase/FMN adenylyltransferase [Lentimonas sp.]|jgi:riboflavin kinase/FMN adenylyltransferase
MNVFHGLLNGFTATSPVVTIGTFDGVHVGHQKIIQKLNEESQKLGGESTLFTFDPHPRVVIFPDTHGLKLLQTKEEKIAKLAKCGLKNIIIYPFTKEFSNLSAIEFVRDILVAQLKVKTIVIGYDHQFGNNREGGLDFLRSVSKEYGFEVIEIPAQDIEDVNVSSSKIRKAIESGDIETANSFLGDEYQLSGVVVKGQALGRQIGFPTANLEVGSTMKLIPENGVYVVSAFVNGKSYPAMVNIGQRPTVVNDGQVSIEVHILDFNKDIYGESMRICFKSRIRQEVTFEDLDSLKNQIKKDETFTRRIFKLHDSI